MMIRWQEYCGKRCDGQTDGRTDGETDMFFELLGRS